MKHIIANIRKTLGYFKKNGIRDTFFAVLERLQKNPWDTYTYQSIPAEVLENQRKHSFQTKMKFSILVPLFHTNEVHFREMVESVLSQTYGNFELILADSGRDEHLQKLAEKYQDDRIRYHKLAENKGISENTNAALEFATGDYIGLLDHDDLLTPDALYEMAYQIDRGQEKGIPCQILYSDEDKYDEERGICYEVNKKTDFNLDYLLSNNYICHFLVMKAEVMQNLKFRCNFDGSQDYDLILRGVKSLFLCTESICHIPKVLYHWRCHPASTASNPASKQYAYDAGKRAIESFLKDNGWKAKVYGVKHLGFYRVEYEPDIFTVRQDIGIIGGKLIGKGGKVIGGIYGAKGENLYAGLHKSFSGYLHRAVLMQDADAVDLRFMKIRKNLIPLFEEVTKVSYKEDENGFFDAKMLPKDCNIMEMNLLLCKKVREQGFRILWEPSFMKRGSSKV